MITPDYLENIFAHLLKEPLKHSRFINTLSMLEYIGARKIIKSQIAVSFTVELLNHVAEEIRHAQILKKWALRLSDKQLTTYEEKHLLAGREAQQYIQTVDRTVEKELGEKDVWLNYLFTTLAIEERALSFYSQYQIFLEKNGVDESVTSILREEERHLGQIRRLKDSLDYKGDKFLSKLQKVENEGFNNWIMKVLETIEGGDSL